MAKFSLPDLPYDYAALEPNIDEQTMRIHHDKHHGAYVNNLNAALEKHPEFSAPADVNQLIRNLDAVPADMYAEANRAGAPVPSPDPDPGTFQRAWEHLPEPAQEKTLDIVLWRNGPLNTASLLPADFIWGDPKTAHDQYQTVLSYLQHHPDVAIAEYLRRHPGV